MSRYFCPDCESGQEILLNDDLTCDFCGGSYKWSSSKTKNKNPAHYCMGPDCDKYLGHRGFCSTKCHDKHYDEI